MVLLVNMHLIKGKGVHWYQWKESLVPIENNVIPMVLLVNMHLITNINNSLSWTKQAVEVEKKANKIVGFRSKGTYSLVALLSRNGPICPWAALYASTTPSPGVHRTKGHNLC